MKARLMLLLVSISSLCSAAYALTPSNTEQSPTSKESVVSVDPTITTQESDTAVEVRNNSTSAIFVIQKGLKQEVAPKGTYPVSDGTTYPVSITPTSGNPTIKYVTLAKKGGACKFATCLIVR